MSLTITKEYRCNLCHEIREPKDLLGLNFTNLHDFRITAADVTDGSHICSRCMVQIEKWIESRRGCE
jgi:hypothetical protein